MKHKKIKQKQQYIHMWIVCYETGKQNLTLINQVSREVHFLWKCRHWLQEEIMGAQHFNFGPNLTNGVFHPQILYLFWRKISRQTKIQRRGQLPPCSSCFDATARPNNNRMACTRLPLYDESKDFRAKRFCRIGTTSGQASKVTVDCTTPVWCPLIPSSRNR